MTDTTIERPLDTTTPATDGPFVRADVRGFLD